MAYQSYANSAMFQEPVYCISGQQGQNTVHPAPMIPGVPVTPSYIPSGGPLPPDFSAPQAPGMMPIPDRPLGCPPGLEYLTQIDQLLVHQKVDMAEVVLRFEMNNAYIVKNSVGQQVFTALEENDCLTLQFCGPDRPFTIHIQDNLGQEVLTLTRPLRCSVCWFPCCLQELEVQNPPGNPIGYVVQDWYPFLPKFTVLNEVREPQLKIKGPFCDCTCMSDVTFEVKSLDESAVVGRITKQWGGFMHESFTDADNFGISFPIDLDVKMKAVMLGACFLIDFMFFERNPQNSDHQTHYS